MTMTPPDPDPDQQLEHLLTTWTPDLTGTLLFIHLDDQVLLIHKKRGHGAGLINGPGGKLEPGETPLQCAIRETREETGVTPIDPQLMGTFRFVDLVQQQWLGYIFVAHACEGNAIETAEGLPWWAPVAQLPFERMWPDDRFWLPRILAGEQLEGEFLFDDGRLLTHRLRTTGLS